MELLYGTGNPAELEAMRRRLAGLDFEILAGRGIPHRETSEKYLGKGRGNRWNCCTVQAILQSWKP